MAKQQKKKKRFIRLRREMHAHGTKNAAESGWAAHQAAKRERNKSGRRGWHTGTVLNISERMKLRKELVA